MCVFDPRRVRITQIIEFAVVPDYNYLHPRVLPALLPFNTPTCVLTSDDVDITDVLEDTVISPVRTVYYMM